MWNGSKLFRVLRRGGGSSRRLLWTLWTNESEILDSHGGEYEDYPLLICAVVCYIGANVSKEPAARIS
jgi:hypothetical protein